MIYNSLGGDGAGTQFYFIAPLRFRDVMLAKNLLTFIIFCIEVVVIYAVARLFSTPTHSISQPPRSHGVCSPSFST